MKKLVLMITEKCNFRCDYCIQKDLGYSVDMSDEVLNKSIDLFKTFGFGTSLSIDLFGGEPLLRKKQIFNLIKNNPSFNYELTTNGSLLDNDTIKFFVEHNVSLVISFDGKNGQKHRPFTSGLDSTALLINRIKYISSLKYDNFIINITPNVSMYDTLIEELHFIHSLGVNKITADCWDNKLFLDEKSGKKLLKAYIFFLKRLDKKKFIFTYNKLKSFLEENHIYRLNTLLETISISSCGDIYIGENACHDKNNKMYLGNVLINGEYVFKNYKMLLKRKLKEDMQLLRVLSSGILISDIFDANGFFHEARFLNYLKIVFIINKYIKNDN